MPSIETPVCMFCRIRPATSAEHIVANALGGRKVVRGFSCVPCNNRFGSTIDKELEEAYRFPSLLAGAYTGKKRPVAPLTMTRSDSGERVQVEHGGSVRHAHEATVTLVDDADPTPPVRPFKTFNIESIAQMVAAEAVRRGQPGVRGSGKLTMIDSGPVPVELSGALGGPEQFRAVAKMSIAALMHRGLLSIDTKTRKLCRWISAGEGEWAHSLDAAAFPAIRTALGTGDGVHVLAVWPVAGRLEATFLAFGFIPYRVRMPGSTATGPFAHVVDPVNGTHEVVHQVAAPDLLSIKDAFRSQEADNDALRALFDWVHRTAQAARLRGTVAEAFEKLKSQGHEFLELEQVPQLSADIVAGLFPERRIVDLDWGPLEQRIGEIIRERRGQ